jgi:SAM-dependent methyltransferase
MTFDVAAEAYDRFMGRYSEPLSPLLADLAGVAEGQRALDVGCGPGALTSELVRRLGAESVAAADPSEPFVAAARERHPGVTVEQAPAEELPFEDDEFDVALAQLVVHFMADPVAGLREMGRVTRPSGVVAACVWDHAGDQGPLSLFWDVAHALDPDAAGEGVLAGTREGHLEELFREAGLDDVEGSALRVAVEHPTFEDWWEPYTLGVGPAGAHVKSLEPEGQERLREACRRRLPEPPFRLDALAWAARAR